MRQIKEKSTETAATVNGASATHKNQVHIEDTIKKLIRQVEPVNFNLEDLFIWFQQSSEYLDRPRALKARKKLENLLAAKTGIQTYIKYIEDAVSNTAMEYEYQGFIYGFRIAVSLLNYASEVSQTDRII